MQKIRVTKIFNFEMAHYLYGHDGECKNIHGHSYKLYVTVIGKIINDNNIPKNGMVIDFSCLKNLINENIINSLDHCFLINKNYTNKSFLESLKVNSFKLVEVEYQTTCENIICDIAKKLNKILPNEISLFSLKLYETENSYAEWYSSDNE